MKYLRIILLSLLLALMGVPTVVALASDISDALFFGVIRITNADTEATNVATTANISTTNLINGGYLNASANNSVIRNSSGADIAFMPGYTPDDGVWSMFVPTIGDNSLLSYILYTADSSGGKIRYFPDDAGMATTDDASLELVDNFTIEQKGYVDTDVGADKNLIIKDDAFRTYISGATDITSEVTYLPDFPVVAATDGGNNNANNTDHTVNMPDTGGIDAGDLLLVFFISDGSVSITFPEGWTDLDSSGLPASTGSYKSAYRVADGGEGATITVTTNNAEKSAHTSFRITGYEGVPEKGTAATGDSDVPNPPNLTPSWDQTNTLWFVVAGHDTGTITFSGYPADYGDTRDDRSNDADGVGIGTARRELNAASDNPGAFTLSAANQWAANTVAIRPATATTSVTATGVASGEHMVKTEANGLFFGIGVDQTNSDSWPIADDLVLNAPLYHTGLDGSPFTTKDANEFSFVVTGATWTSDGRVFDGNDDLKHTAADWQSSDNLGSILVWFKTASNTGNPRLISSNDETANSRFFMFRITETTGGLAVLQRNNDTADLIRGSTDVSDDVWHMGALISSGTTYSIYLDGSNAEGLTVDGGTNNGDWFGDTDDRDNLMIGAAESLAGVSGWITGTIGDVLIYGRALTPTEIQQIYDTTKWKYDGLGVSYLEYELVGTGVLDNANDWAVLENGSMPYMESHEITIGGTQAQFIEWEYAATFTDQSANSNDATPTFRTDSSDADVTADMVRFAPISEAQAPGFVLTDPNPFLTPDTGNITSGFTTTPPTGTFPLAPVIVAIANATSTPPQLPLLIIATFVILAASMSVSAIIRRHGSGSIIIKIITIIAVMGVFVALRNFGVDFWMIVIFLIIGIALAMGSKQLGWT